MQLYRSARWLMPALLLFAMPTFAHAEVFKGVGSALHMLPVLGQTQTDATAQPQAPEKAPANRKHLNVSVGPVRMHLPISGKRPLPVTAPANGNTATGTPDLVHPVQQPLGNPSQQQEPTAKGNAPGNGGNPAGIVVVTATSVQDPTKVANVSQQPAGISNRSDTGVKGKAKSKGVYSMNDGRTDQPTRQGGTAEPQAPGAAGRIDPAVEESRQAQQAQQPGTTGSTPHDKQSYSLKVVELRGDDATAIHAAPLPAQPKGITATANSSSASGTKNAVIPNHAAPSPTQPHPGMIFDRWGNLVVEPDPEQPKMNTGVAPTQTRTNTIPVGGGSPVIIVPQGREATQTRVGPCPPHVVCRGEDAQPNKPLQVHPAPIPNPRRAPEARQEFPVGNAPVGRVEFPVGSTSGQKAAQPAHLSSQPTDALTVTATPGGSVNAPLSGRQAAPTFTVTNSGGTITNADSAIKPTLNQNGKVSPQAPPARDTHTAGGLPRGNAGDGYKGSNTTDQPASMMQPLPTANSTASELPATVGGATVSGPPYVSAAHGTTSGGSAPQAKPGKKKSKISVHVTF